MTETQVRNEEILRDNERIISEQNEGIASETGKSPSLQEREAALKEDAERLADGFIKLDEERAAFEAERAEFNRQKANAGAKEGAEKASTVNAESSDYREKSAPAESPLKQSDAAETGVVSQGDPEGGQDAGEALAGSPSE